MGAIMIPRAGRIFFNASMAISLAIGALQMFHVRAGWITDYGADLFGTAWVYATFRQARTVFLKHRVLGPETTAGLVFLGCAATEFGQKFDVVPGIFDPFDLLAFATSVLACYVFDRKVARLA